MEIESSNALHLSAPSDAMHVASAVVSCRISVWKCHQVAADVHAGSAFASTGVASAWWGAAKHRICIVMLPVASHLHRDASRAITYLQVPHLLLQVSHLHVEVC